MLSYRRGLLVLATAAVLALVVLALPPREPVHRGKTLTSWLEQCTQPQGEGETLEQVRQRWASLTNTLHSLGPKALPFAVRWISEKPSPSLYDKIQYWAEQAMHGRINLPSRPDRSAYGLIIFQILGPKAAPAIAKLNPMLFNERTCGEAAMCLAAIGPAATSALTNGLESGSWRIRYQTINALGQLGPVARGAAPALKRISRSGGPDAVPAVRALAEVEENSADLLPYLIECLGDTNTAPGAAYALARLRSNGIPPLLLALTNSEDIIRAAAEAALDPRFQKQAAGEQASDFYARSGLFDMIFNSKRLGLIMVQRTNAFPNVERGKVAPALLQYSTNADPALRSAAKSALEALYPQPFSK